MQQSVPNSPFFTNDVPGLIKVLLTVVVPTTAAIVASVWKFMRGDLQAADARLHEAVDRGDAGLRRDIDGPGPRVSAVETRQSELESQVRAMSDLDQATTRELALGPSAHDATA